MKTFGWLGLVAALLFASVAFADPPQYAKTVSACGTPGNTPVTGNPYPITMDTTGALCTDAVVTVDTVTISGTPTVNVTKLNGNTVSVGSGVSGTGTIRVIPSTDSSTFVSGYTYNNITTDTTTAVKSGAGTLHSVCINTPLATSVITIYDNTAASGTTIGTYTIPVSPVPSCLVYDVAFATGLTVKTTTAASDITVSYR